MEIRSEKGTAMTTTMESGGRAPEKALASTRRSDAFEDGLVWLTVVLAGLISAAFASP
jgi:hypothetical protein